MIAFRRMIRRHLERVVKENSHKGLWFLTPWQYAVWRHQVQAESRVFSHPFPIFSTTWTVNTGWRPYHGYLTYCWIFRPEGAVQAARELRSEGWEDVFICSTRFGLAGPSHYVTGDLEDPAQFSRLALELERTVGRSPRSIGGGHCQQFDPPVVPHPCGDSARTYPGRSVRSEQGKAFMV